ncbi:EAL domain-containing protein [Catenovulum sp. 2E275]|uniref:bifunctional diguanylate cyclase/phosphodiesterase n=1 Tax=Catenovulum sp. 2E275 TaxID=2980497 RepID=UPI0021D1BD2E|nr:EAL domain-containing protein [Catenovulum sp. 2E275]MCU4674927.1 EAL domain-containing protein [Catenovulum sp. 2E275]
MQWLKTKIIHSISIKASIAIFFSCVIIGVFGVYFFTQAQDKYVEYILSSDLDNSAKQSAQSISRYLDGLVTVGSLANIQITHSLNKAQNKVPNTKTVFTQHKDSSYRAHYNQVGLFLAANQNFSEQIVTEALAIAEILPEIGPKLRQLFSAAYFISKDGLAVVQPAQIIDTLPAVYDFNRDLFYKLGTPEFNPTGQPIWTPVYYDDTQSKWMTTLVIPVYTNKVFRGITGYDFLIDSLDKIMLEWLPNKADRNVFIFDSKSNLIFHPEHLNLFNQIVSEQFVELNNQKNIPQDVYQVILTSLKNTTNLEAKSFTLNKESRLVSVSQVPELGWYLAMSDSLKTREFYLQKFKKYMLLGSLIVAFLLSVLIYWFLNRYVLSRLRYFAKALTEHKQGQLKLGKLTESSDEVGTMARTMEEMSSEIHHLIEGLNEKIQEKEVAELSALKLSNAVKHSETAIAILNEWFEIEFVNPKFVELCGRQEFELIGIKIEEVIDEQMRWLLEGAYEKLALGHAWKGELIFERPGTEGIWVSQTLSPMTQDKQGAVHFVSATQDISFIKQSQRKMENLAYHDPLTQLYNRTFFKAQLTKSLEMTKRGHFAFCLLYFDLDNFKRVNDDLGHEAGDQLLIEIAKKLTKRLRAEDTIARLGGDEFAVIISGVANVEKAAALAHDIQNIINQPVKLPSAEVLVTASIGITISPKDAQNIEDLLRNADLAMYKAKAAGRNTFYFYSDELNKALQETVLLESELRVALKEQQFELYYQPQINLKSGELFGFEALLRWQHPTRGMVSPNIFIPVAEQSGLIVQLGEWVLAEASLFIARINQKYNKAFMVAVNLSARQFKDKNVANVIKQSIVNASIKPAWLDIELTESMLMGDINEAIRQMDEIKSLGVQLSIDDFGTGYSSLSYLKRFPVDTLKVDRAFIKDIPDDKDDMAIADAIIAMAHKLNMKVIAEGVENNAHVQFLREKSCQIGQGYLFSPPVTEQKIEVFLEQKYDFMSGV